MAEYIKRTDVMKICEGYSEHCFNSSDAKGQDIADRILDDVVELSAADVEEVKHEVKHGEWKSEWSVLANALYFSCSLCGEPDPWQGRGRGCAKYCPKCGAKNERR